MANNLTIKQANLLAVAAFAGVEDLHSVIGPGKLSISDWNSFSLITHVVAFTSWNSQLAQVPGQEVAYDVYFGAASAVGRPSASEALYYRGDFYYRVTWSDIGGGGRQRGLRYDRVVNGQKRIIQFYRKETDPEHIALLSAAIADKIV